MLMRVIDVHNHLYSKEWIEFLAGRKKSPRMQERGGAMVFYSHDTTCAHITNPGHYDVDARIKDMDACRIDTQIVSHTLPSVEELPVKDGVRWAGKINDYFIESCEKYPGRLYAYATLPLQDVGQAEKELDRVCSSPAVKGIGMFSNVNFKPISSPEYDPIYRKAEAYGLPIFIHPAVPTNAKTMQEHGLRLSLYGYTFDTTIAVVSLAWKGVLERFPNLKIIHAHFGGVVPYLSKRLEDCWRVERAEFGLKLPKDPAEYYKRQVYVDSISGYLPAMKCGVEFMGTGHICLGTDYAHGIGNWEQAIELVQALGLTKKETKAILGGNAAKLFKIE
jgi:aminocarboxymuconate-semialdehyde decarboxylase